MLQSDSSGPIFGGARLRENISFAQTREALIPTTSPANEVASVSLPRVRNTRRGSRQVPDDPQGSQVSLDRFLTTVGAVTASKPYYRLFSDNCRWFARRIVLTVAEFGLVDSQRFVRCGGELVSDDAFLCTLQSDRYGGRQLAGPENTLVKARLVQQQAENYIDSFPSVENLRRAVRATEHAGIILNSMPADSWSRQHFSARNILIQGRARRWLFATEGLDGAIEKLQLACGVAYRHLKRSTASDSTDPMYSTQTRSAEHLLADSFSALVEAVSHLHVNRARASEVRLLRWVNPHQRHSIPITITTASNLFTALESASRSADPFIGLASREALLWLHLISGQQDDGNAQTLQTAAASLRRFISLSKYDEEVGAQSSLYACLEEVKCYERIPNKFYRVHGSHALAYRRLAFFLAKLGRVDEARNAEDDALLAHERALTGAQSASQPRYLAAHPPIEIWDVDGFTSTPNTKVSDAAEAVAHYQKLYSVYGDRFRFELSEALYLSGYAIFKNHRDDEQAKALDAISKAVALRRTTLRESNPPSHDDDREAFADMLDLEYKCGLRSRDVAIRAAEEAVSLRRATYNPRVLGKFPLSLRRFAYALYFLGGDLHRAFDVGAELISLEQTRATKVRWRTGDLGHALIMQSVYASGLGLEGVVIDLESKLATAYGPHSFLAQFPVVAEDIAHHLLEGAALLNNMWGPGSRDATNITGRALAMYRELQTIRVIHRLLIYLELLPVNSSK